MLANSVDPDQTLHTAASDLGLHCLPRSQKLNATLIWYSNIIEYSKRLNDLKSVFLIGLIWKMANLKSAQNLWNFTYFVVPAKLRNAENLNLISWIVLEL